MSFSISRTNYFNKFAFKRTKKIDKKDILSLKIAFKSFDATKKKPQSYKVVATRLKKIYTQALCLKFYLLGYPLS